MATSTETLTYKKVLNQSNPSNLAQGLKAIGLGDLLEELSGPTSETLVSVATRKVQLSKAPIAPIGCLFNQDSTDKTFTEVHASDTPGAQEFTVDYSTGEITLGSGAAASGENIEVTYLGISSDENGAAVLASDLAATYGASLD